MSKLNTPPGGGGLRVPPHNLPAEESLLGAMLLSRDAIAAASEIVRPEHFYKPAHTHIYAAILGLYAVGEPSDPITITDELTRAGLIDSVGGVAAVVALQANAPATSNAARYARIIEELAVARGMITVANEIAELGYSMPDDVSKAVDLAESKIYELARHRESGTMVELKDSLGAALDRLEQLFEAGDAITGTPTGYQRSRRAALGSPAQRAGGGRRPSRNGQDLVRSWAWPPTPPSSATGPRSSSRWRCPQRRSPSGCCVQRPGSTRPACATVGLTAQDWEKITAIGRQVGRGAAVDR